MDTINITSPIDEIASSIEIPSTAYDDAKKRYEDLGTWLQESKNSKCAAFNPHVFPQGSFRLGTVIRPLDKEDDYDLDLSCKLQHGLTKQNATQKNLKDLLGDDLETYRTERGIKEAPESKHRCWRLYYQDQLSFHMDAVPGIPSGEASKSIIENRMIKSGSSRNLSKNVAEHTISITDDREKSYPVISENWHLSNPEGYALWFEFQMEKSQVLVENRDLMQKSAKVDKLPTYQWKSILQKCIQVLKRHRDIMFRGDPGGKPISIIITTLAGRAYEGENDLSKAMNNILFKMGSLVNEVEPRVPNPVNTEEDFADKWPTEEGQKLNLEQKFWEWLVAAQSNFDILKSNQVPLILEKCAAENFGVTLQQRNHLNSPSSSSFTNSSLYNVPWRQKPIWQTINRYSVSIEGKWGNSENSSHWNRFNNNDSALGKHLYLRFKATTNTSKPYQVYWQVVNTGDQAIACGSRRGEILPAQSVGAGGLYSTTSKALRKERTLYTGTHWVECYIVKDDTCVARSGPFIVNIK